ncbi:sensor histidine kinase [Pseudonocardia sp. GCM10023141]|uniref:sensor histidine kinase n=1 Tax=Pseudonocardia sp. GCM10023141 TaxID=3252653 RepID=UPI003610AA7A
MTSRGSVLVRVLVVAGLLYTLGGAVATIATIGSGWFAIALVALLAVLAGAAYLAVVLGRVRRGTAALLLGLVAVGVVENVEAPFTGLNLAFVTAFVAPLFVRLPVAAAIVAIDAVATAVVFTSSGQQVASIVGVGLGLLFTGAFAAVVHQLSASRRQAEVVAGARADAAVLAERQRMAREIHDLLAHTLSAQIVHLEGARMLMERGDRPEQAHRQVVGALQLARDGLEETKRALSALRGDELRVVDRLAVLVVDFRATGPGECELCTGAEPSLAADARWAIVRTAQEALTNVRKHAAGAAVAVTLGCREGWCELEVLDSGGAPGPLADSGAGFGLTGMRERAELIGGSLEAGRSGDGFRVRLRVPLAEPMGAP